MHNVNLQYSYIDVSFEGKKKRQFLRILCYSVAFTC